jgi:hypothetical protein
LKTAHQEVLDSLAALKLTMNKAVAGLDELKVIINGLGIAVNGINISLNGLKIKMGEKK